METKWLIIFVVSILISIVSLVLFLFFDFPFLLLFLFLPIVFGIKSSPRGREEYPRVFCRRCGSRLPPDSMYCPSCGVNID
ncbi:MAG: zinc ribbon domain-containing protein [Candidatus Heimdallarchaeota archaeon]|nr:MAG: zinc ribbon domain-containing protein [Candidatus Heimdallarchaeota archaeon]